MKPPSATLYLRCRLGDGQTATVPLAGSRPPVTASEFDPERSGTGWLGAMSPAPGTGWAERDSAGSAISMVYRSPAGSRSDTQT